MLTMDAAKQIKELRESTGMSRKDFSEHTGIPVRTLEDWEAARRTHPEYIAFEFASWVSPEFKLYIIKDYKRLKTEENSRLSLSWNLNREISKLNNRVHTDSIKENLIPKVLTPEQISYTYASEADLLNTVLFGNTAKEWRDSNPNEKGNIRDAATSSCLQRDSRKKCI